MKRLTARADFPTVMRSAHCHDCSIMPPATVSRRRWRYGSLQSDARVDSMHQRAPHQHRHRPRLEGNSVQRRVPYTIKLPESGC